MSVRTHCPYCALQCGLQATDSAGAVTVVPDPDFPVNRGQLCIKGFRAGDLLSAPGRLTSPLVRSGGVLRPASWEAALDFVAERLQALRAEHGPEALAAFGSGALTNEKAYLLGKFVRLALRSPHIDYNGRYCMSSAAAGQRQAFGVDRGLPFPVSDIGDTEVLVLWGANSAETMPPLAQWLGRQKERGGKLVVIDPRLTETGRAADLHLALTPGSDLTLANGLLHLVLREGLVDEEFVQRRTTGFEELRRMALSYDPTRIERATGVSGAQQLRLVHWLAGSKSAMLLSGRGPEQQVKGSDTVGALINLMLALGKVGRPNSGYGCITGQGNGQGGREHGQKADQLPGYRLIEHQPDRAAVAAHWGVDAARLPGKGKSAFELLDALGPGGIRALLVFGSNVAVASPDAGRVLRRLQALDLLVVADAFENETAELAHVVLPVTQWAEEDGTMTNLEGRVILRQAVRPPPPGVRSDLDILCGLAARLGESERFTYASAEAVFDELCRVTAGAPADYSGMSYGRLREEQGVQWPCPSPDHPGTPRLFAERFHHPDGKARFRVVPHRRAGEEPDADYPYWLTTGRYKEHYNSGAQTRRVRPLLAARPAPLVELHPRLAGRLGVESEDRVRLETRRGAVELAVTLSSEIRPDTVFVPFHWGGAASINLLTNPALDPTSRMPEFKVCAVRVTRVAS
jgi:assimilatory nitrate reductase catalytic subunit